MRRNTLVALFIALLWLPLPPAARAGGIGGTGITSIGVVQGFGSIFVNGHEYFLGADTRVFIDGRAGRIDDLKLGQAVVVRGRRDARGRFVAREVRVRHVLQGSVGAIERGGRVLVVMGRRVEVSGGVYDARGHALAAGALRPGDVVRISGLSARDGKVAATRAVRVGAREGVLVRGTLQRSDAHAVMIDGRRFALARAVPRLAPGTAVVVRGDVRGGEVRIEQLRAQVPLRLVAGERVDMVGFARAERAAVVMDGLSLRGESVPSGRLVGLSGIAQRDGIVTVEQVAADVDVMRFAPARVEAPGARRNDGGDHGRDHNADVHTTPEHGDKPAHPEHPEKAEAPEKPEMERPDVARPEVEHPEPQRPEIELPHGGGN